MNYALPPMSKKQLEVYHYHSEREDVPIVLCDGSKLSGKTTAVIDRIIKHSLDTEKGRIAVFSKTLKLSKDGGVLCEIIDRLKDWGIRHDYTPKTHTFRFKNSVMSVIPLVEESQFEQRLLACRFSAIYMHDLESWPSRLCFEKSFMSLRMAHLPPSQHLWIADAVPVKPPNQKTHWIYQMWYERTNPKLNTHVISFRLPDNPFLDRTVRTNIRSFYQYDTALARRQLKGRWK